MDRRTLILGLGSIAAGFRSSSHAQSLPSQVARGWCGRKSPRSSSYRPRTISEYEAIREAVDFWNAEFAQLGSPFRFGAIVRSFRSISAGHLVALKAKSLSPSLVNSMREANGDVIVVLSDDAGFNPFAFPSPALRKVLVAIPSFRKYPFWPAAARNVVAHELGHARWIGPQRRCSIADVRRNCPVRLSDFPIIGFAPLTSADKAKLLEMYPPNWQSNPSRRWKADPPAGAIG